MVKISGWFVKSYVLTLAPSSSFCLNLAFKASLTFTWKHTAWTHAHAQQNKKHKQKNNVNCKARCGANRILAEKKFNSQLMTRKHSYNFTHPPDIKKIKLFFTKMATFKFSDSGDFSVIRTINLPWLDSASWWSSKFHLRLLPAGGSIFVVLPEVVSALAC